METTTSKIRPKLSLPDLELKNNHYVIPSGGLFNYFVIKVDESTQDLPIMKFERCPPLVIDGVVIFRRKMYEVTVGDLLRGIIRKSREIKIEDDTDGSATTSSNPNPDSKPVDAGDSGTPSAETIPAFIGKATLPGEYKSGVVLPLEVEIAEALDAAWENQVDTLLDFVSSKEGGEWEITSVAQPGRTNEGGTVQDPD